MTDSVSGANRVEQIRQSAQCPQCSYDLRAQQGEVVTCPECGTSVNMARLIRNQWTGAWYRAPYYNALALSVAVSLGCVLAPMFFGFFLPSDSAFAVPIMLGLIAIVAAVGHAWRGIVMSRKLGAGLTVVLVLVLHAVLVIYMAGVLATVGSLFAMIAAILELDPGLAGLASLALRTFILLGSVGLLVAGWYLERFVAGRCIRCYLRHVAVETEKQTEDDDHAVQQFSVGG